MIWVQNKWSPSQDRSLASISLTTRMCRQTCWDTCMDADTWAHMHTRIHTYTHTRIHTHQWKWWMLQNTWRRYHRTVHLPGARVSDGYCISNITLKKIGEGSQSVSCSEINVFWLSSASVSEGCLSRDKQWHSSHVFTHHNRLFIDQHRV